MDGAELDDVASGHAIHELVEGLLDLESGVESQVEFPAELRMGVSHSGENASDLCALLQDLFEYDFHSITQFKPSNWK